MATRLSFRQIVNHPVRAAIVRLVEATPGIPFLELYAALRASPAFGAGVGYGSLAYHLQLLEKFRVVTSRKSGRYRRYYRNGGGHGGATTALSVLQSAPVPEVVRLLLDRPGASQKALWEEFRRVRPCSRQALGYHLARLVGQGLLDRFRAGRHHAYFATDQLHRLLVFLPPAGTSAVAVPAILEPAAPAPDAGAVPA